MTRAFSQMHMFDLYSDNCIQAARVPYWQLYHLHSFRSALVLPPGPQVPANHILQKHDVGLPINSASSRSLSHLLQQNNDLSAHAW